MKLLNYSVIIPLLQATYNVNALVFHTEIRCWLAVKITFSRPPAKSYLDNTHKNSWSVKSYRLDSKKSWYWHWYLYRPIVFFLNFCPPLKWPSLSVWALYSTHSYSHLQLLIWLLLFLFRHIMTVKKSPLNISNIGKVQIVQSSSARRWIVDDAWTVFSGDEERCQCRFSRRQDTCPPITFSLSITRTPIHASIPYQILHLWHTHESDIDGRKSLKLHLRLKRTNEQTDTQTDDTNRICI